MKIEAAKLEVKSIADVLSRRQATGVVLPITVVPAATYPVADGADEAKLVVQPTSSVPRRQSKRTCQANPDTQALGASAQPDQSIRALEPSNVATDQALISDAQTKYDTQWRNGIQGNDGAQPPFDTHCDGSPIVAPSPSQDGGNLSAQVTDEFHAVRSPQVAEIIQLWRMRQRWHRAEKSLILQGKALCRAWTSGDKAAANELFERVQDGEAADPILVQVISPFLSAIGEFSPLRSAIEKQLKKLAQSLPVWPWVKEIKGFGPINLPGLIGEAGDIGSYRNPSCLWKRMGMAVIDGGRQRKISGDAALIHGYSPQRRCVAYLLGEALVKAGDKCRYRDAYTRRREHTAITHPDWNKGHSHNDAMRVMTKRVLRDLWVEWRRVARIPGVKAGADEAISDVQPNARSPRRQSKRAGQAPADTQVSYASTQPDQFKAPVQPTLLLTDQVPIPPRGGSDEAAPTTQP